MMSEVLRRKMEGDSAAGPGRSAAQNKMPAVDDGGRGMASVEAPERDQYIPVKKPSNLMDFNKDDSLSPNKTGKGFVH